MSEAITAADDRIGQLFDVRKDAVAPGRLIEDDITKAYPVLRAKGSVQKGALHEHLGSGLIGS
jgi:hypothetical protein